MEPESKFRRFGYYLGPLGAAYAWVVILICAHLNPWWDWTGSSGGALSYMGDPTLTPCAWVYDYVGMVVSGLLLAIFSIWLFAIAQNRFQKVGGASFLLSGLLLVLIGIFHQTPGNLEIFHEVFSLWFFLQSLLSIFFFGIGLYRSGRTPLGLGMVVLGVGTLLFYAMIGAAFGSPIISWVVGLVLIATGLCVELAALSAALESSPGAQSLVFGVLGLLGALFLLVLFAHAIVPLGIAGKYRTIALAVAGLTALFGVTAFLSAILPMSSGGLVKARLVLGAISVIGGVLIFFAGVAAGLGSPPGATGEVLGIVGIDAWVTLLFFVRPRPAAEAVPVAAPGTPPGVVEARPSLLQTFQFRALLLTGIGMFLFGFANYYVTDQLGNLLSSLATSSKTSVVQALATTVGVTLAAGLSGYLLVVLGTWRWRRALPRLLANVLVSVVIVLPPVMILSWFFGGGNTVLLWFLFVFGALLPLACSIVISATKRYRWNTWGSGNSVPDAKQNSPTTYRPPARIVSVRQGWIERLSDVGDIVLDRDPFAPGFEGRTTELVWRGVRKPYAVMHQLNETAGLSLASPVKPRKRVVSFLAVFFLTAAIVLILTLVPVYQETVSLDLNCALYLNVNQLETDPWPFLHNVSLPWGQMNVQWWSGTPVWVVVLQLPKGIAYQNAPITSLVPGSQGNLTSTGSSHFESYGGTGMIGCVATTSGGIVSMDVTYNAPIAWA